MAAVNDFHELVIWQRSHKFAVDIYRATKSFPHTEQFGLTSQIHRASVSIPSNIAEGSARDTARDFCRFLVIARGSLAEVQAQLHIARDLDYLPTSDFDVLYDESIQIHKMMNKFISSIKKN